MLGCCLPPHPEAEQRGRAGTPSVPWDWRGGWVASVHRRGLWAGPRRGLQTGRGGRDHTNANRTESHHFISKRKPTAAVSGIVLNTHNLHICSLRLFHKMRKKPQPAHKLIHVPNSNTTLYASLNFGQAPRVRRATPPLQAQHGPHPPTSERPGKGSGGSAQSLQTQR